VAFRSRHLLVAVPAAVLAALLAMFVATLLQNDAPAPPRSSAEKAPGRATSTVASGGPSRPAPTQDRSVAAPPAGKSATVDLEQVPTVDELDKYYPGLRAPYAAARDHMLAAGLRREQRRCLRMLPERVQEVSWAAVESYDPTDDGRQLVLAGTDFVPGPPEQHAFIECMTAASAALKGSRIELSRDQTIGGRVQVRSGGQIFISSALTEADVLEEIASLQQRVDEHDLGADRKAILKDQLDLYICYRDRGLARRRECMSQ